MSVASPSARGLADLVRTRPEWRPWLAVLELVTEAAGDRGWRLAVPEPAPPSDTAPALAGATLTPDARLVRRWGRRLLETAAGAEGATALARIARADDATLAEMLECGLAQDGARVSALAVRLGVEAEALGAVTAVAPVPLLRACAERWRERVSPAWSHGYCPICGAWPALAEARGLERARRLRCGRCAADWDFAWLKCVYCGMDDHARLGRLVSDADAAVEPSAAAAPRFARAMIPRDPIRSTTVETCLACRGYLKTVTTLGPTPADELGVLDLATVELDVAAIGSGYSRPVGPGAPLGARVHPRDAGLLRGWRS